MTIESRLHQLKDLEQTNKASVLIIASDSTSSFISNAIGRRKTWEVIKMSYSNGEDDFRQLKDYVEHVGNVCVIYEIKGINMFGDLGNYSDSIHQLVLLRNLSSDLPIIALSPTLDYETLMRTRKNGITNHTFHSAIFLSRGMDWFTSEIAYYLEKSR